MLFLPDLTGFRFLVAVAPNGFMAAVWGLPYPEQKLCGILGRFTSAPTVLHWKIKWVRSLCRCIYSEQIQLVASLMEILRLGRVSEQGWRARPRHTSLHTPGGSEEDGVEMRVVGRGRHGHAFDRGA